MYPLRFEKVFINKIWGGDGLNTKLGMTLPKDVKIGESWEISSHPNGMSIVENGPLKGKTLQEVYNEYKEKLVGKKVYNEYKNIFPLLIKYLDINDRLSIQVHPDDRYSLKHNNELGKSESWYIIDASDDAKLILGTKKGIDKKTFLEKAKKNDFKDMFEERAVKTGDFIDVNPGTVHASIQGSILIAEIQENSDVTYRIYDFDREENGIKRELHLEEAAEVIDFDTKVNVLDSTFKNGETTKRLVSKKYYTIDKIRIESEYKDISTESMIIYSILNGEGKISWNETESLSIKKGESLLIPVNLEVIITGSIELLRTVI